MPKNKTSRFQKIKNKIAENPEDSIFWSAVGLATIGIAALTVYAVREENRIANETNQWIQSENSKGNSVFTLADGSYLSVPTAQYVNQI